ncbi:sulfatase-like hydrolase/transferase [Haloarchaeobius sp. TZWSO28]|uniref:sulfatase-like hydrolase/transferase n=1 Tax=Haloarchaeobius sp. TZWSO28 TaxID=3446119 RepID=UPI003EB69995
MSSQTNVLLIMSDEHRPDAMGCAGHGVVETPALDRLADQGVRFENAYCSSPLCAPSRASFATGRYVHETGHWDNATPYDGTPRSWGHHFTDHGVPVTTIGKLDFDPGADDGFTDQRLAQHRDSPDVNGLQRDPPILRDDARERILAAGEADGEAWYEASHDAVTAEAVEFLRARGDGEGEGGGGSGHDDEPWVLWANYLVPHFPLVAATEYYDRYPLEAMDLPEDYPAGDDHPILEELRDHFDGRDLDEDTLRRTRAAYYALCTVLDDYVDQLLDALDETGLADDTLVIYVSDHGEPLGDHECWWKCCMYEQAVGVPMIVRGPGVDADRVIDGPVSLLDVVPTMAAAVGIEEDPAWRGRSLLSVLRGDESPTADRAVFSEYHAHGTSRGAFMLRQGRFKFVYYPDRPAQLFDLEADPGELVNLAGEQEYAEVQARLEDELRSRVDPEAVDERARREQHERFVALSQSGSD